MLIQLARGNSAGPRDEEGYPNAAFQRLPFVTGIVVVEVKIVIIAQLAGPVIGNQQAFGRVRRDIDDRGAAVCANAVGREGPADLDPQRVFFVQKVVGTFERAAVGAVDRDLPFAAVTEVLARDPVGFDVGLGRGERFGSRPAGCRHFADGTSNRPGYGSKRCCQGSYRCDSCSHQKS